MKNRPGGPILQDSLGNTQFYFHHKMAPGGAISGETKLGLAQLSDPCGFAGAPALRAGPQAPAQAQAKLQRS